MFRRKILFPVALLLVAITIPLPGFAQATNSLQITNFATTPNGLAIGWQDSTTGAAYTVQFQDTIQDKIWRLASSPQSFPISSNQWVDLWPTNLTRFYRVIGVPAAQRGKVLSNTLASTFTRSYLGFVFAVGGVPITPQYDVRAYKVVYETITPLGARTRASGALLLPVGTGTLLPLVCYQHGTVTQTNKAPSSMDITGEVAIGLAMATTGYAVIVPDYLGLGDSPGLHPFQHARSEATACVDMLRATRTICATNGFPLTNRLFLAGYSQGGHATMALCRELESFHTSEFAITACAPMAGAYDMSGVTTTDFLSGRVFPNPYYFLYLLAAYQDVYHLAPTLADLLTPPYNTTLPPLVQGNSTSDQMNAAMPADPTKILKPEYLAAFKADPRHPLRLALQDNDLYRWKPLAPMHMFHCAADQDVIIANSQVALASFQSLGATQVLLFDPKPDADHTGCAQPSLLQAKSWFDSLK